MTTPADTKPGPSWPLFTMAALSFVPFLGIFFGGAGATWGLVSSRRRALWAALLAMSGALLNVAFILVLGVRSARSLAGKPGSRELAQHELLTVVTALDKYHDEQHSYPATLEALRRKLGPLHPLPLADQTGAIFTLQLFQYQVAPDGESYDLFGVGPDKKPGTADDVRPVLSDSLKAHSGYRPQLPGDHP